MLPLGRLRIWILTTALVNHACTGIALAIPAPATHNSMDTGPRPLNPRFLGPRADLDILSFLDSSSPATAEDVLPPIKEVLQAMMSQQPTGSVSVTSQPSPSVTSVSVQSAASITATAIYPSASPPKQGPGIVILSSTVLPGFTTTGRNPEPTSKSGNISSTTIANDAVSDTGGGAASHKVLIVGSIIGAITCVALFLFFVLDPSFSSRFRGLFSGSSNWRSHNHNWRDFNWRDLNWRSFRSGKEDQGISHLAEPSFLVERGSTARVFGAMNPLRYSHSPIPEKDEKAFTGLQANSATSKFSIYSTSEYLSASPRDSAVTATTDSTRYSTSANAARATVTFASSTRPARPPRPPTADSPALSDSVYLACSNQPYVIVAPPPLKDAAPAAEPPLKKMLTPSEFFALHMPAIISSLVGGGNANNNSGANGNGSGNRKRERERVTLAGAHKEPAASERPHSASLHSRTKSAPLLGSLRAMTRAAKSFSIADSEDTSSSEDSIAQRVTKHRRSRSASGWAYPDRQRARKPSS